MRQYKIDYMNPSEFINDMVGGIFILIIAVIIIYSLLVIGNRLSPLPGGAAVQNTANNGVLAIVAIFIISGLTGFIKLLQWINESVYHIEF